ncbi:carnitine O-palmitoyltransferase 2, mitochondrial [Bombus bifarius]|uniref:Carnitine O-palmitoyltransferase 2, mitochondrial n=1 Tax=Bombus bifarius TaxID=103933 RepID=A0A6P8N9Z3_9HYME|nr:carnitine O-palmitoyltransferase 2, mitochondrial [Bombus bifarius]
MLPFVFKRNYFKKELIKQGKVELFLQIPRSISVKGDEAYQYIEKSKTPTMHFQPSLPRLPIPKLEDTCRRYLNAQKPLLSKEQLEKTEIYVNEFLTKDGIGLHKELIEKDTKNRDTSYISEPWFDMYLRDRRPLPINYNPFLVLNPASNPEHNIQLVKATNLIVSSLRFMKSLKENVLRPEVFYLKPKTNENNVYHTITRLLPPQFSWYGAYLFKAFPLDMSQYHNLFNTTRLPKPEKDQIYENATGKNIIVMRKGHFYSFNVIDENGYIRKPKEIASCLESILGATISINERPIGILTTSERDLWANTRAYLSQIGNQEILQKIDSAIFTMILDDMHVGSDYNELIRTYLHADGTNRWFDKSFSLIVTNDGYAGINFEHSWGDGVAVLRFLKDIGNDITKQPKFCADDIKYLQKGAVEVEKLNFVIDDKVQNIVNRQKEKFGEWIGELSVDHMIFNEFGKNECKTFGVSPDAIMQLAFQLALYYQRNCVVPTYESCSTAAFKHGRTETLRSCTIETKKACEAIAQKNNNLSKSELKNLIINCSNVHNKLSKEAVMGQGFDRHLFALKKIWEHSNTPKPAIFSDPAYDNINHNILSTSTLSDPAICAGGFGPVVNNGYGIGYMIQDERLGAIVTSYKRNNNANEYVKCLEKAFKNIHSIMTCGK